MSTSGDIREDRQPLEAPVPRLALRIGEAAAALSISRSKMYGLIKRGKVRTVLVGDVMRIRVSDLENYLTEK
jgi:excisionase family DNA binding protein